MTTHTTKEKDKDMFDKWDKIFAQQDTRRNSQPIWIHTSKDGDLNELWIPLDTNAKQLKQLICKELQIEDIKFMLIDGLDVYVGEEWDETKITIRSRVDVSEWEYYPVAHWHYGSDDTIVICDNCGEEELGSCWGIPKYGNDLCRNCFEAFKYGRIEFKPKKILQDVMKQPTIEPSIPLQMK